MAKSARRSTGRGAERSRGKTPGKPSRKPTNLSLDPEAVARGEEYGRRHGTSLSQLVSDFLRSLPADRMDATTELAPPVRRLFGVAARAHVDRDAHRAHLLDKYGGEGR